MSKKTEVFIVGAGPVGLSAALPWPKQEYRSALSTD